MVCVQIAVIAAFSSLALASDWRDKIQNVVVLVQENRSFDTFAGGLTYNKTIDGLVHHNYCNYVSVDDDSEVCTNETATAKNVAHDDPNHSITGVNMQIYNTYHPKSPDLAEILVESLLGVAIPPQMMGFVSEQLISLKKNFTSVGEAEEVIKYYAPEQIPVFNEIAQNFVLFDRWFSSIPGPTNPNRAYITSGTSAGHGTNDDAFSDYGLTQKSVFQQLDEHNITWKNYSNSTFGSSPFNPDAAFYSWTRTSGRNNTNIHKLHKFHKDAADGNLPQFSYINPECCNFQSFHPPSPISLGEDFVKDIYESVRNSPQWNTTLFILTFDEHGGFGDHVLPPACPAGDDLTYTETAEDGKDYTFDFKRLGVRVPTVLISPWVGKGLIEKKGTNNGGEYTHTSILKFLSELWSMDDLTPRVSWSSTFEHLINEPVLRNDTPSRLRNNPVDDAMVENIGDFGGFDS